LVAADAVVLCQVSRAEHAVREANVDHAAGTCINLHGRIGDRFETGSFDVVTRQMTMNSAIMTKASFLLLLTMLGFDLVFCSGEWLVFSMSWNILGLGQLYL
jgi:hypothetical protein